MLCKEDRKHDMKIKTKMVKRQDTPECSTTVCIMRIRMKNSPDENDLKFFISTNNELIFGK